MTQVNNTDLEHLFERVFFSAFNTKLKGGAAEPVYIPANYPSAHLHIDERFVTFTKGSNIIFYRDDYFRSALHEIAHWCIAGKVRRQKLDFGYWYESDGRNDEQQSAFQQVEIKPQAIEYAFCQACHLPFRVSIDNLNRKSNLSDEQQSQQEIEFFNEVSQQLAVYKKNGFPKRAQTFIDALSTLYQSRTTSNGL